MNSAPLYPNAWNIWSVAMTGEASSSIGDQLILMDDLNRTYIWLKFTLSDVSNVSLLEPSTQKPKTVRRREQMDVIPMLPAGTTHNQLVRFWYDGDQESVPWPHDDQFMLLTVFQPDAVRPAPVSLIEKLETGADTLVTEAAKAASSVLWAVGGAALAIGIAWYIFTSTPKRLTERTTPSGD